MQIVRLTATVICLCTFQKASLVWHQKRRQRCSHLTESSYSLSTCKRRDLSSKKGICQKLRFQWPKLCLCAERALKIYKLCTERSEWWQLHKLLVGRPAGWNTSCCALCLVFSPLLRSLSFFYPLFTFAFTCSLDLGTQKHVLISDIVLFLSELLVNIFKCGSLFRFDRICYIWSFDFKWDLFFYSCFFLL